MPRLTARDYLKIRHFLIQHWQENDGRDFAELPGYAQRELHDFFAPTVFMTDEDVTTHRAAMSKAFRALPQSAGRAFEALCAALDERPNQLVDRYRKLTTRVYKVAGKPRKIRMLGVSRPTIDPHYLAEALLRLAEEDVDGKLLKKALKAKKRNDRAQR